MYGAELLGLGGNQQVKQSEEWCFKFYPSMKCGTDEYDVLWCLSQLEHILVYVGSTASYGM